MEAVVSVRDILLDYIQKHNINISSFAQKTKINVGSLSNIVQGRKIMSYQNLKDITIGMGLPEDYYFDLYANECIENPTLRRIKPFMKRCGELNRLDCIEIMLPHLESYNYIGYLFQIAEEMYTEGIFKAAELLYSKVSEAERFQHSERLAICQYRIFQIGIGDDLQKNFLLAIQFEPYALRLEGHDQLESIKKLLLVFGMVHKWDKVDALAKELHRLATIQYNLKMKSEKTNPKHPLYYYILYSYLARSTASAECEEYDRALYFVEKYADAETWIRERDEESQRIIAQFADWATANRYLYRLKSGNLDILKDYIEYIATKEDEIFIALRQVISVANIYNFNIDDILERFAAYIPYQVKNKLELRVYSEEILKEGYAQFLNELAVYRLSHHNDYSFAVNCILESLKISITMNSSKNIISSMTLFEEYREKATHEARETFKELSREVRTINEKTNVVILGSM